MCNVLDHSSTMETILSNDQHENELENVEKCFWEKIYRNQSHPPLCLYELLALTFRAVNINNYNFSQIKIMNSKLYGKLKLLEIEFKQKQKKQLQNVSSVRINRNKYLLAVHPTSKELMKAILL